jgi:acyl-CoA thioesterase
MTDDAVFALDGPRFLPGRHAIGPWAADKLHGGPVLGLIARAVQSAMPDPELVLARLNVDMFRPVPAEPLMLAVETIRQGSRLALLRVTVHNESGAFAQGSALLLRASGSATPPQSAPTTSTPAGPEGLPSESLMRNATRSEGRRPPAGFHTRVETRWPARTPAEPLAIWFRMPLPLIAGEPTTPLVAAIALCDFANAVASIAASERGPAQPYINADATLYLTRAPQGDWFCLQDHGHQSHQGISTAECIVYDASGPLGRVMQARLAVR